MTIGLNRMSEILKNGFFIHFQNLSMYLSIQLFIHICFEREEIQPEHSARDKGLWKNEEGHQSKWFIGPTEDRQRLRPRPPRVHQPTTQFGWNQKRSEKVRRWIPLATGPRERERARMHELGLQYPARSDKVRLACCHAGCGMRRSLWGEELC